MSAEVATCTEAATRGQPRLRGRRARGRRATAKAIASGLGIAAAALVSVAASGTAGAVGGVVVATSVVSAAGVAPATLNAPVVGAATTGAGAGAGWWEVAADGGIFTFGDASFHGSAGALRLNRPVVGMASTPDGGGYFLVASDGGIFTYGDAIFRGSTGAIVLNRPIVGMAVTPDGGGYFLVASDGGIFTFGDAAFRGSTGAAPLGAPIVGMAPSPTGAGYWLIAADGEVAAFGAAANAGAPAPAALGGRATGLIPTASGAGYWITDQRGDAFAFGDAVALGTAVGVLGGPVVAAAPAAVVDTLRLFATDGSSVVLGVGGPTPVSAAPTLPSASPGDPSAFSFMDANADGSPVRWNPCAPIHYETNLAEAPAGAAGVIAGAVAQTAAATGMVFVDDGATTEIPGANRPPYQPDRYGQGWAPVVIAWARPSDSSMLPGGNVLGESGGSWAQASGGPKVFVSGEIVIDADNTVGLSATFGAGATLGQLMLHGFGHLLGLGHSTDPAQIMYPVLLPLPAAVYGAGDLAGLARVGRAAGCLVAPTPEGASGGRAVVLGGLAAGESPVQSAFRASDTTSVAP